MSPLIESGDRVIVEQRHHPLKVGDIVLATVHGTTYLHKVTALSGDRVQIGNNHGRINGWTHISKVWGVLQLGSLDASLAEEVHHVRAD
jgi:signal peptidase I